MGSLEQKREALLAQCLLAACCDERHCQQSLNKMCLDLHVLALRVHLQRLCQIDVINSLECDVSAITAVEPS